MATVHIKEIHCREFLRSAVLRISLYLVAVAASFSLEAAVQKRAPPLHPDVRLENFTVKDGLPTNEIWCITQDHEGFMWFGTMHGLVMYDGYTFTTYQHDPRDSTSLPSNEIRSLLVDRNGELWIAMGFYLSKMIVSQSGIHFLNFSTGGAAHVLFEDPSGNSHLIWMLGYSTTEGSDCYQFNIETNTKTYIRNRPPRSSDIDLKLFRRIDAYFNSKGISRIRNDSTSVDSLPLFYRPLLLDHDGHTLWSGGANGGLWKFNLENYFGSGENISRLSDSALDASAENFLHDQKDPTSISDDFIRTVFQDRNDVLWVGTYSGGISRYSLTKNKFTTYTNEPFRRQCFTDTYIRSLFMDTKGIIWIGGTTTGLTKYDRTNGKFKIYTHDAHNATSIAYNSVRAIHECNDGNFLIGMDGGLDMYDPLKEVFHHVKVSTDDGIDNIVSSFYADPSDPNHSIWVGQTNTSVLLLRYPHCVMRRTHGLGHNTYTICAKSESSLWLGTYGNGLIAFNRTNYMEEQEFIENPHDEHSLGSDRVFALHQDKRGSLWVGTDGGGLNRLDTSTGKFQRFTTKDGLPSNTIFGILEDNHENLWVSTINGLAKFNPLTGACRNYFVADGLMSNEFNGHSSFKTKEGEMFFGGSGGFVSFFPDSVKDNLHPPQVVITSVQIGDSIIRTAKALSQSGRVELPYSRERFTFEFVTLHYADPARNQSKYRLEGFESTWTNAGTKRTATYTNLDPGEYVFRVKGSNSDGVWNEQGASIRIIIASPYWATWWFRGCASFLIIGSSVGLVRYISRRKLKRKLETLERQHAIEQERTRISTDLHDHLGSQLTRISLLSGLAQRDSVWEVSNGEEFQLPTRHPTESAHVSKKYRMHHGK